MCALGQVITVQFARSSFRTLRRRAFIRSSHSYGAGWRVEATRVRGLDSHRAGNLAMGITNSERQWLARVLHIVNRRADGGSTRNVEQATSSELIFELGDVRITPYIAQFAGGSKYPRELLDHWLTGASCWNSAEKQRDKGSLSQMGAVLSPRPVSGGSFPFGQPKSHRWEASPRQPPQTWSSLVLTVAAGLPHIVGRGSGRGRGWSSPGPTPSSLLIPAALSLDVCGATL
jgi:hypothetical protein